MGININCLIDTQQQAPPGGLLLRRSSPTMGAAETESAGFPSMVVSAIRNGTWLSSSYFARSQEKWG